MKLRVTCGTTDGTPPGGVAEVPDNEAQNLIRLGYAKPVEEEPAPAETSDEKPVRRRKTSEPTGVEGTETEKEG